MKAPQAEEGFGEMFRAPWAGLEAFDPDLSLKKMWLLETEQ